MTEKASDELAVRYRAENDLRGLVRCIREFDSETYEYPTGAPSIRLAIVGNYSTQFLAQGFPLALALRQVRAVIFEGGYNSWQLDLIDGSSPFYGFEPTHVVIALTSIELAYGALRTPEKIAKAISVAVERVLKNTNARLVITLPEPLSEEVSDRSEAYEWRRATCSLLHQKLQDPRVSLIDLEPLVRHVGAAKWYDERFYDTSKLPFHPDITKKVLERLVSAIAGTIAPQCKLVICDLDDTLWSGRVGDEGWQNINLDAAGPGRHHLRLQLFLKGLVKQGVLLAIASKNEIKPVHDVFENRPEMILRLDDFVSSQIHWEPKSTSIERILSSLNLSTAGVIFLDDNPAEREEVRRRFPEIIIPELTEGPATWVHQLLETGLFDRRVVTEESNKRQQMYLENAKREAQLASSADLNAFLADLDMEMTVYRVSEYRDRVLELIQKTNQFNLTTRRYEWAEIDSLEKEGFALCYSLKDRFGDNGIVSVLVATPFSDGEFNIELFLMSCRVMGRAAENAIVTDLVHRLKDKGATRVTGVYIPTAKNAPVADLYIRLGFSEIQGGLREKKYVYHIGSEDYPKATPYIRIVDSTKK